MENINNICPLCNSHNNKPISADINHLRGCRECGIVFNSDFRPLNYNDNYFLDDYKKQYGKTYIEDYDNIYKFSVKRLEKIEKLLKDNHKKANYSLLDIGSAAGFFLKAARDKGFGYVNGIEISSYAANYCAQEYNIDVINSSFERAPIDISYDVITAWYFIEHNHDPGKIIQKIYNHLNDNGIFAFSVPSIFGPQYIFQKDKWILSHPVDHRIDFSPSSVKRYLKKSGFRRVATYPGGIHPGRVIPERYAGFKAFDCLYSRIAEFFSFSDTLEVYAVK